MTIVALEALTFGLGHMVRAAAKAGERLCLLTGGREIYAHELSQLPPGALDVYDVDTTDTDACAAILRRITGLTGLINSTDTWLVPGARLAAEFGLPGRSVASALFLRDKQKVRQSLYAHGISPPPGDGLPAVLKDSSGTSSRNVWLVRTPQELAAARAEAAQADLKGHVFAEPLFEGPVYSAETITWDGRTRLLGVLSRHVTGVREDAAAFPVAFPPEDSVAGWVARVLDVVEFEQGFAHVEFVLTQDGPHVVEINARIGGALVGEALCRNLGMNVYEAMVDMALGREPALLSHGEPTGPGVAFALVYPSRQGILTAIDGVERLAGYPGRPEWYPTKAVGDRVEHLTDQRGCVGIVLAEGPTSELAMHRALAAAAVVSPTAESPRSCGGSRLG